MKNMIKEIVATDKASRLEVDKALERRELLEKEIAEQKQSFEEKCREEAKAKIETAKQQLNKGLEDNIKTISDNTAIKRDAMLKQFDDNHSEWEQSIFNSITEG